MPTPDRILDGLEALTNEWRPIAAWWHAYFAAFAVACALGWRPRRRLAAALLVPPLLSAGALAWWAANPFTGVFLPTLGAAVVALAWRLPNRPVRTAPVVILIPAFGLLVYAWVYPSFIVTPSIVTWLVAAPVGVIPCPTLAMGVAFALLLDGLDSRSLSVLLGIPALFYGLFGTLRLGVVLDWGLVTGALLLLLIAALLARRRAAARLT